jgi:DNA-binding NarL/FixJ family response regulator
MNSSIIIASNAIVIAEIVEKSIRKVSPQCKIEKAFDEIDLTRIIDTGEPLHIFLESNFCEIATAYLMAKRLSVNSKLRFIIFSFEKISVQDMGRFYSLGAVGYIDYRAGKEECFKAISELFKGNEYFSQEAENTLHDVRMDHVKQPSFTIREIQVLKLTAKGKSLEQIAELLSITLRHVQNIKTQIYTKAGIKNNVQVMLFALSLGYVTLEEIINEQEQSKGWRKIR